MFQISSRTTGLMAAVLVAIFAPAAAQAASVEKTDSGNVMYSAEPGENNDLTISDLGDEVAFSDPVGVTAGANCEQVNVNTAKCPETGIDTIYALVTGGTNEVSSTTAHPTVMHGTSATKNTFYAGYGENWLVGGDGDDELFGSLGVDHIEGGLGADEMEGADGDDELIGGDGPDLLSGQDDDDLLDGGPGDDTLDGGLGADRIEGGSDVDVVDYSDRTEAVHVSLGTTLVPNDGALSEGDDVSGRVENVLGGEGDDVITASKFFVVNQFYGNGGNDRLIGGQGQDSILGQDGDDRIEGGSHNDIIEGDAGDDRLLGGDGADALHGVGDDDTLDGGPGADFLNGGDGEGDTVTYASAAGPVSVDLDGVSYDDGIEGEGDSVQKNVENATGSRFGDVLAGNAAENRIRGGRCGDLIRGLRGSDRLLGQLGADNILARDGFADAVRCAGGNDRARVDKVDSVRSCERAG